MKAKIISVTLFVLTTHLLSAQNISVIEKQLNSAFQRIDYWSSEGRDHKDAYDSLASANRQYEGRDHEIEYDKKNKIISIPLIQADSRITAKKIQYQFKGKYFEKL